MTRGKPNATLYGPFIFIKVCIKFRYNIDEKLKICLSLKFCIGQNFCFSTVIKTSESYLVSFLYLPVIFKSHCFIKISLKNCAVPNRFRASW